MYEQQPHLGGATVEPGRVPNPSLPDALPAVFVNSSKLSKRQASIRSHMGWAKRYATGDGVKKNMAKANSHARAAGVSLNSIVPTRKRNGGKSGSKAKSSSKRQVFRITNPTTSVERFEKMQVRSVYDVPGALPAFAHTVGFGSLGFLANGLFTSMLPAGWRTRLLNRGDGDRKAIERAAYAQAVASTGLTAAGVAANAIGTVLLGNYERAATFWRDAMLPFNIGQLMRTGYDWFNATFSRDPRDFTGRLRYLMALDAPYTLDSFNKDGDLIDNPKLDATGEWAPIRRFTQVDKDGDFVAMDDDARKKELIRRQLIDADDNSADGAVSGYLSGALGNATELFDPSSDAIPPALSLPPQAVQQQNARAMNAYAPKPVGAPQVQPQAPSMPTRSASAPTGSRRAMVTLG